MSDWHEAREYKILRATSIERLEKAVNDLEAVGDLQLVGPPQVFGHEEYVQAIWFYPESVTDSDDYSHIPF